MLVLHFIGLAMGIGTSIAFIFLGVAASKMEPEEAVKFQGNTFILSRMGHIGITLLILTGGYLMTPFWSGLADRPALVAKLAMVVVLVAMIIFISVTAKKAKATGDPKLVRRLKSMGPIALLVSLSIVVLATMTFH